MDRGYFRHWRCSRESWIVKDHPAFILFFGFFLPRAAWKPTTVVIDGRQVFLHPGDVIFGRKRASDATGLSEKCVRNTVERLTRRASIRASQRASTYTVYSIVNWGIYQSPDDEEGQPKGQPNAHERASTRASTGASKGPAQGPHMKNVKALEEVKEKICRFRKPSLEEVTAYCREKGYTFSPEAFMSHYESNGWKVGKNPMVSWKGACGTWGHRDKPSLPFCADPHGGLKKVTAEDFRD